MNQSKIAVRYAKALFLLAQEKNILEKVNADIELIFSSLKDVKQFGLFLKSPVIKPSEKVNVVTKSFSGSVSETTMNFLLIVLQNKREADLESIVRRFVFLYREFKGVISATITTAVSLDNETKTKLLKILSEIYKTNVELEVQEDASLIGGFVLKVDDQQLDTSISTSLKRMKNKIMS